MQKHDVGCLVLGIFMTAVTACGAFPPRDQQDKSTQPAATEVLVDQTPLPSPETGSKESLSPTTIPSALPGTAPWRTIGSERTGLELDLPPDWVNLSDRITIPTIGNQLGINLLFAADSERTGRNLLVGKDFSDGAYLISLAITPPAPDAEPAAVLAALIATTAPSAVHLTDIEPVTSANGVPGYALDLIDGPIGLRADRPANLYSRVALFAPQPTADQPPTWIALLLSASPSRWPRMIDTLARITASVRVFNTGSGPVTQDARIALRGSFAGDRDQVSAMLARDVRDIWRFTSAAGRYASLVLRPEAAQLDLGLTLFGPDQQPVVRLDNGFTGATESIADLVLPLTGDYLIEVSDYNHAAGRYTLAIAITDEPQYREGGALALGEVLHGQLPPEGYHDWRLIGATRQQISVVVMPGMRTIDPILELHGPDGRLLLELDEGFSGDPELITGFELPANGEYVLRVRNFSELGGPYTISLDEGGPEIANFYDAGDLVYGDLRRESLQLREVHTWFFEGITDDHLLARVTPLTTSLDVSIWLLDAELNRLAAVDRFPAGESETIEITLPEDGPYIIVIQDLSGNSGDYEIALGAARPAIPESAGRLAYGDSVMGLVEPQAAVAWTFNAQTGDTIRIEARPANSNGDLILALLSPDGREEIQVDNSAAGQGESIDAFPIPTTGEWQVVLREFLGEAVSYRLAIDRSE